MSDDYLTVAESAKIAKTCANTIKAAILRGRLPAQNVGKGRRAFWRVRRGALLAWLDGQPQRHLATE